MNRKSRMAIMMTATLIMGVCLGIVLYSQVSADGDDDSGKTGNVRDENSISWLWSHGNRENDNNNDTETYETAGDYTIDVLGAPYDYQQKLDEMVERNPETAQFAENYPTLFGTVDYSPLTATTDPMTGGVPLLMQWDSRWGYMRYGSNALGLTGCGPTCLSMVAAYLLDDSSLTPAYMADFSISNGYCIEGSGTSWALMSEGGAMLGLDVTEIPVDEDRIIANLEVDNPIIMIMGPGEFTTEGHFVVLCGYEDGYYTINDPYSHARSEKKWTFDEFSDQILNLWVFRVL